VLDASVVIPNHFERSREVLAIEKGLKLIPTLYGSVGTFMGRPSRSSY
jgi:hypothetical protein